MSVKEEVMRRIRMLETATYGCTMEEGKCVRCGGPATSYHSPPRSAAQPAACPFGSAGFTDQQRGFRCSAYPTCTVSQYVPAHSFNFGGADVEMPTLSTYDFNFK